MNTTPNPFAAMTNGALKVLLNQPERRDYGLITAEATARGIDMPAATPAPRVAGEADELDGAVRPDEPMELDMELVDIAIAELRTSEPSLALAVQILREHHEHLLIAATPAPAATGAPEGAAGAGLLPAAIIERLKSEAADLATDEGWQAIRYDLDVDAAAAQGRAAMAQEILAALPPAPGPEAAPAAGEAQETDGYTYDDLLRDAQRLTPAQRWQQVKIIGENLPATPARLWVLEEDHIDPSGEGLEPASAYADDMTAEEIELECKVPAGSVFLCEHQEPAAPTATPGAPAAQ